MVDYHCYDKQCLVCSNYSDMKWNGLCWQPKTKCYYCNGVDGNHETNCRCYIEKDEAKMSLVKCETCSGWFSEEIFETHTHNKEQVKMTREDAVKLVKQIGNGKPWYEADVAQLEALGLLKFDEAKSEVKKIFAITEDWNIHWCDYPTTSKAVVDKYGAIRLEEWPEGLVLWVGGVIVWKSWEITYKVGEEVVIRNTNNDSILGYIK